MYPLSQAETFEAERLLRRGVSIGPHTVRVWYDARRRWTWRLYDRVGLLASGRGGTMHDALSRAHEISRTLAPAAWRELDARGGVR